MVTRLLQAKSRRCLMVFLILRGVIPACSTACDSTAHESIAKRTGSICAKKAQRNCSGECVQLFDLGAVGLLQFDVVAFRLQDEYGVQCAFDNIYVYTARWVYSNKGGDYKKLDEFRIKAPTILLSIIQVHWCISAHAR